MAERNLLTPSVALAAYAESLLDGRRVIVFGHSNSQLAERLLERGARLVHVYDRDSGRVAEATLHNSSRSISFAPLSETGLAVRDGAFDVAIIEDLSEETNPAQLLRRAKRSLNSKGVAIISSRNSDSRISLIQSQARAGFSGGLAPLDKERPEARPGQPEQLTRRPAPPTSNQPAPGREQTADLNPSLSYYELYDLVSGEFDEVRMLGQTPFIGYAVVDFSPTKEPQLVFDNGFVPGGTEEPEFFLALASTWELKLDEFSVIQLSAKNILKQYTGAAGARQLESAIAREKGLRARLTKLEEELSQLRESPPEKLLLAREQEARADAARKQTSDAERSATARAEASFAARLAELKRELEKRDRWVSSLEARAGAADSRADTIQNELDATERKLASLSEEQSDAQKRLSALLGGAPQSAPAGAHSAGRGKERNESLKTTLARLEGEHHRLVRQRDESHAELRKALALLSAAESNAKIAQQKLSELKAAEQKAAQLKAAEQKAAEQKAAQLNSPAAEPGNEELTRLEAALRERGVEVRRLERELSVSERLGKQLLAQLLSAEAEAAELTVQREQLEASSSTEKASASITEPPAPPSEASSTLNGPSASSSNSTEKQAEVSPSLHSGAQPLVDPSVIAQTAEENARLKADLQAASWTIDELRGRLNQAQASAAATGGESH